jgi:hypothetical protein
MIDHGRFQQLAATMLDFAPSRDELRQLDAHLHACVKCREFAADLQADAALVRMRPAVHAPDQVRQTVVDAAYRSTARASVGRLLPLVAAVVIALALVTRFAWLGESQVAGPLLPSLNWSPLGDVSVFGDGLVAKVILSNDQLIAVGGVSSAVGTGTSDPSWAPAAIWVSADGLTWRQLADDPAFADAGATDVAAHGGRLAVLGMAPVGLANTLGALEHDATVSTFRVWLHDGLQGSPVCSGRYCDAWHQVTVKPPYGPDTASLFTDLEAGGPGFVLVGTLFPVSNLFFTSQVLPTGAIVATSADGTAWSFNDPTAPEFAGSTMRAVVAGPSGLVAVGDTGVDPTVWYSADGVAWTRVEGAVASASATIRAIAAGPSGWVAVGDDQGTGRSWVSADGRSWKASSTPPGLVDGHMLNVTWLGSEFIATGVSRNGTTVAWHSLDGLAWSPLDITSVLSGVQVRAAGAIGSRELLFGFDPSWHVAIAVGQPSIQP